MMTLIRSLSVLSPFSGSVVQEPPVGITEPQRRMMTLIHPFSAVSSFSVSVIQTTRLVLPSRRIVNGHSQQIKAPWRQAVDPLQPLGHLIRATDGLLCQHLHPLGHELPASGLDGVRQ